MMPVAEDASSAAPVSLVELLSSCVDAARKGCAEIRAVQLRRRTSGGELASTRKDADDPRSALTEADTAAQLAIVNALRTRWPGLRIVGEEEEDPNPAPGAPLRLDLCDDVVRGPDAASHAGLADWTEPLDALTVFVDPVDGTREFVEGRLDAVQCLVGVACRGRAVAGAIGLPFQRTADESSDDDAIDAVDATEATVVWGLAAPGAKSGALGACGERFPPARLAPETALGAVCVTGDSTNASLAAAKRCADAAGYATIGGAGNKILAVAEGRAEVALMHFGTSLWDTCAPEAVLRAAGGRCTDLFGAPLVHDPERPGGGLINDLGVLATGRDLAARDVRAPGRDHDALAAAMRGDDELRAALLTKYAGEANPANRRETNGEAFDVARCLDGAPLEASWVGARVSEALKGGANGSALAAYAAPESSAIRGLMSDACRLELAWRPSDDGECAGMPDTVFYKKVALGDLEYARTKAKTQPMKIARDVKSAAVEAAFLAAAPVAAALADAGVRVPRCFAADLRPSADAPIESKFALLLEDYAPAQGWRQERLLSPSQARATLSALARMHALFTPAAIRRRAETANVAFDEEPLYAAVEAAVWPAGAYWQPAMQPASQMTELAATWEGTHAPRFAELFDARLAALGVDHATLGARLQAAAPEVGAESHPFGLDASSGAELRGKAAKWRTLIHGDAKAANVFLREARDAAEGWEVGLIDFQWMGFGLGAVDAAHVVAASVDPETLGFGDAAGDAFCDPDAVPALLDHYHRELCVALAANGAAASAEEAASEWTREEVQEQYEAAVLDLCRVVFGYQWVRVKASPESILANAESMNKNSYNKSIDNALWLVRECDALLKRREARRG